MAMSDAEDRSGFSDWRNDIDSSRSLAEELPYTPGKSSRNVPVVTVFGGGVAGLTTAHELIERGFRVQLVEPTPDPQHEYDCFVGGLASSQPGRLNETRRLHWMLYEPAARAAYLAAHPELLDIPEEAALSEAKLPREALMRTIRALRESPLQQVHPCHALPQRLSLPVFFDESAAQAWPTSPLREDDLAALFRVSPSGRQDASRRDELRAWFGAIPDLHGEVQAKLGQFDPLYLNSTKLHRVCTTLLDAIIDHSHRLHEGLDRLRVTHGELFALDHAQVRRREILLVEIRGYCNLWPSASRNRAVGLAWAQVTKAWIVDELARAANLVALALSFTPSSRTASRTDAPAFELPADRLDHESPLTRALVARLVEQVNASTMPGQLRHLLEDLAQPADFLECSGFANPDTQGHRDINHRIASNFVSFRTVEHVVMGEHGFRYFPGFYRHVFDTMGRTPLLDSNSQNTGRSLLDQLVVPPPARLGAPGPDSDFKEFKESTSASIEETRQQLEWVTEKLGFTFRDELRYTVQLLKFLSSCPERRRLYQDFSWWEFIDGKSEYDKPSPEEAMTSSRSGYSKKGTQLLRDLPQLLVAMSADESDALTNGNVAVQLLLDMMQTGGAKDRMLNGPTSEAWLEPWKRYLKKQGVSFFRGSLERLEWDGAEPLPIVSGPGATGRPIPESPFDVFIEHGTVQPTPDFYVSALPYAVQTETVWRIDGLEAKKLAFARARRSLASLVTSPTLHGIERLLADLSPDLWACELDALVAQLNAQLDLAERIRNVSPTQAVVRLHARRYANDPQQRLMTPQMQRKVNPSEDMRGALALSELAKFEALVDDQLAALDIAPGTTANSGLIRRAAMLLKRKLRFLRFQSAELLDVERDIIDLCVTPLGHACEMWASDAAGCAGTATSCLQQLDRLLEAGIRFIERARALALHRLDGDFERLMAFDVEASRRDASGWFRRGRDPADGPYGVERSHTGLPQPQFSFPLRDLTGIQYYFRQLVRVGHGRFTLPDAPWGITGVGQAYIWQRRPSLTRGYIGQLSVDIANLYAPYAEGNGLTRKTAWQSSAGKIAFAVWDQIVASASRDYATRVAMPRYFQIDRGLHFGGPEDTCQVNENMLMINLPGKWQARPGIRLDSTGRPSIGYTVSNVRWVMAGTYMATTTRLTTMEAANESGRQAVNTILETLFTTHTPELYNSGGTFAGDYCRIWDPEENELPDFLPLKRLDKALMDRNIPHFLDVLGVRKRVDAMPTREDPMSTPAYNLSETIHQAFAQLREDWRFLPELSASGALGIDARTADLRKLAGHASQVMEMIMKTVRSQQPD